MLKITMTVNGMMCGMCEAHVNEAVRNAFDVENVTSSHAKNQTVILTQDDIEEQKLRDVVDKTGYQVSAIAKEPYKKKGLFRK